MSPSSVHTRTIPPAWRFALIGALASLPLAVVVNWLPNSETDFAGGIMIFGAFIAGLIAATRSAEPDAAGLRAGLLAGVVGIFTPVAAAGTAIGTGVVAWPTPSELVFFVGASAVVLCLAPVFGSLCGRVGGWAANRVATRWTADAS
ncbi:DUF5518 domain-containing protein [Halococcus saccharolyticus]|uniref:DUF5518 domain-containing protein n=1 Tax=Halococcus saccharolyticus TaxID=62319 RepID=UPI0009B59AD7|nr:DUF5518 domain-containing protein [Halococcus saccharolyticus]